MRARLFGKGETFDPSALSQLPPKKTKPLTAFLQSGVKW